MKSLALDLCRDDAREVAQFIASMITFWPPGFTMALAEDLRNKNHPSWPFIKPIFQRFVARPPKHWQGLEHQLLQLIGDGQDTFITNTQPAVGGDDADEGERWPVHRRNTGSRR